MRRTLALAGFAAGLTLAAASFLLLPAGGSRAAADSTFIIPASDGYGIAECLANKSECGLIIANAWCEAQGFTRAERFGITAPEDVTGSVETEAASARPITIVCAR